MKHQNWRIAVSVCAIIFALLLLLFSALLSRQRPAVSSQTKAIVNSGATQTSPEHRLIVSSSNGYVSVFEDGKLLYQTDIPVVSLPAADRAALAQGIEAEDSVALHQLLEDLGA